MNARRSLMRWIAGGAVVALSQGCASGSWPNLGIWPLSGPTRLKEVSLTATREVNGGYPIAVDLVFVRTDGLLQSIGNLRASEWFASREDRVRQNAKEISVRSWELVPGQRFPNVSVGEESRGALGAYVFADYLGEGSFRARVQDQRGASIVLRKEDFEVKE